MRYLRARWSARLRRFSFTSMVCCLSHCCQASFDTLSQMRLPSAPGYGGNSRPSASRPSFTHFTVRGIAKLYSFEKDLRAPSPVVKLLATLGQCVHRRRAEALLEKPVRGMRGEREKLAQLEVLGALLARFEQPLAVARVAVPGVDREAGEFPALVVGERVQRRAADDASVVLDNQEVPDLGFEQLPASLDERAFGLERLDEREHAAHVLHPRRTQLFHRVGGDHGADTGVRKEFKQQR